MALLSSFAVAAAGCSSGESDLRSEAADSGPATDATGSDGGGGTDSDGNASGDGDAVGSSDAGDGDGGDDGGAGDAGGKDGAAPVYTPCTSVAELADSHGLTPAMRQTSGLLTELGGPSTAGADYTKYTSIFGVHPTTFVAGDPDTAGYGYPGILYGAVYRPFVKKGYYIALQFRVPTHPSWAGKIGDWTLAMAAPKSSHYTMAIAPCPGQFTSDPKYPLTHPTACMEYQEAESIRWSVGPDKDRCALTPGRTYYLNAISASLPNLTTTECPQDEECIITLQRQSSSTWPSPK